MPSIRELKSSLAARGVDCSQAIEKSDLIKLVADTEHLARGGAGSSSKKPSSSSSADEQTRSRNKDKYDEFMRLAAAAETLGVALDAPDEVVQAAHEALMKTHHPD